MKKVGLIVLDGWGYGKKDKNDAIFQANTPFIDSLFGKYPNSKLRTDGLNVGLPEGQMGNSEVGHINIGAGRVVYQDLVKINLAISKGELSQNKTILDAVVYARINQRPIHLIGLVSQGGVHSSQEHLHGLLNFLHEKKFDNVFVHAFTDGRDTSPNKAYEYITNLVAHLKKTGGKLASVIGRYFAMDRDNRWERIAKAYNMLVHGVGERSKDMLASIKDSYAKGVTDEFIEPIVAVNEDNQPISVIKPGDVVICFNFRTDRCRQLTRALTQENFMDYGMKKLAIHYITMTRYDDSFENVQVLFDKDNVTNTIGEIISNSGKTQLRVAETEKYPHVTFFFSGGREAPFEGESRIMISSPKVATYDLKPEMSAQEVTEATCEFLKNEKPDFLCLNFANPDMVGHTGVFKSIVKAVEVTDLSCKCVVEFGLKLGYEFIIIADHGNAELARNEDGSPHTAHTINPVPIIYVGERFTNIKNGILADIAPTILSLMDIEIPKEMTGKNLLS